MDGVVPSEVCFWAVKSYVTKVRSSPPEKEWFKSEKQQSRTAFWWKNEHLTADLSPTVTSYSLTPLSQELTRSREEPAAGANVMLLIPSVGGLGSSYSTFRGMVLSVCSYFGGNTRMRS